MQETGTASLPLHYGRAPRWLVTRMQKLAEEIVAVVVNEYGADDFLRRISDPFWFQALGCVLGYDWHSSGVTTVLTAVLKQVVTPESHGLAVCGGKGRVSRQTPAEIASVGEGFGFSDDRIRNLQYVSKISAKVDNAAIQAGYLLYHHAFFVNGNGKWAVIQQGMCAEDRTARRYHWLSDSASDLVVKPHSAIVGHVSREVALDMTASDSEDCRRTSVEIAKEQPRWIARTIMSIQPSCQRSLQEWMPKPSGSALKEYPVDALCMPKTVNWKALREVYEFQPDNYEQLLAFRGVGPATVRGLALIAELIYGDKPSWKDPVKYSFAYGGKDGVPYPVDRRAMDMSIEILEQAIREAKIGNKEKMHSLNRLRKLVPDTTA